MQVDKVIVDLILYTALQVIVFLPYVNINGQNLVPNSGFEKYHYPPTRDANFSAAQDWKSASGTDATDYQYGTPDFFHMDGKGKASIPNTQMGLILPYKGSGVVGLVSYNGEVENFREYIYIAFKEPLQKGKEYQVSVALSNGLRQQYGRYSSDGLGLYFSNDPLKQKKNELLSAYPQISLDEPFCNSGWAVKTYTFIPDQAYTYLTIGNFKSDEETFRGTCFSDITNKYAYIFIDEVSVQLKYEGSVVPEELTIEARDDHEVVESKSIEIDIIANDIYADKDVLLLCEVGKPANGFVSKKGYKVVYTPFPTFSGQDRFTYSICTPSGKKSTAMVTVVVNRPKLPPMAVDDHLAFTGNQVRICALDNDSDPTNLPISIYQHDAPQYGFVRIVGNCFVYHYEGDGPREDRFKYTITNRNGLTSTAMVYLTIENAPVVVANPPPLINRGPVAKDDAYFSQGEAIVICLLNNDFDLDDDHIRILEVGNLNFGRLDKRGDCFQYTPLTTNPATEQFAYKITDDKGGIAEASVVINIVPPKVNAPPIANPDVVISDGTPVEINVLNNDLDPDEDPIFILENTTPLYGELRLDGQRFTYFPKMGFVETDSFSYTISDTAGGQSTALVNIKVRPRPLPVSPKLVIEPTELDGYAYNHITFLIDVSRSMEKEERLAKLKLSMTSFVDVLRSSDKISIVVFSGQARVICEEIYGDRKKELKNYIQKLGIENRTNIKGGFNLAYQTAESHLIPAGNNRIIIASDGKFTSFETLKEIVNEYKKKDICLTIFCFDENISKTAQKELSKLANLGNGNFEVVNPDNSEQLILQEAKQVRKK